MTGHTTPTGRAGPLEVVALAVAGAGHLVAGWYTISLGLLAPLWAILAMGALWLGGVVVLVRLARTRALLAPVVPLVHGLLLVSVVTVGEQVLGWRG
jgi:hypothetical protein